ncbi:MAG: hypothetical protein H6756_04295 [Candidatus Omnitrophica bacterium]|nr:hypothetical protein [Candidatus Omnitrophota bacterium]
MDEKSREAKYGEKMIEIKVRFWTNKIADGKDEIIPKHCWDSGVVRIAPNKSHEIKSHNPIPFRSFMDIPRAIEDCITNAGLTIHADNYSYKYLESVVGEWKKKGK